MYLWLACVADSVCSLNWTIAVSFSGPALLSWFVFQSWIEVLDLRLVCCFLRFKMLKKLSTAIFDSSFNIIVVLWFKSPWTIPDIRDCTLAKYQQSRHWENLRDIGNRISISLNKKLHDEFLACSNRQRVVQVAPEAQIMYQSLWRIFLMSY